MSKVLSFDDFLKKRKDDKKENRLEKLSIDEPKKEEKKKEKEDVDESEEKELPKLSEGDYVKDRYGNTYEVIKTTKSFKEADDIDDWDQISKFKDNPDVTFVIVWAKSTKQKKLVFVYGVDDDMYSVKKTDCKSKEDFFTQTFRKACAEVDEKKLGTFKKRWRKFIDMVRDGSISSKRDEELILNQILSDFNILSIIKKAEKKKGKELDSVTGDKKAIKESRIWEDDEIEVAKPEKSERAAKPVATSDVETPGPEPEKVEQNSDNVDMNADTVDGGMDDESLAREEELNKREEELNKKEENLDNREERIKNSKKHDGSKKDDSKTEKTDGGEKSSKGETSKKEAGSKEKGSEGNHNHSGGHSSGGHSSHSDGEAKTSKEKLQSKEKEEGSSKGKGDGKKDGDSTSGAKSSSKEGKENGSSSNDKKLFYGKPEKIVLGPQNNYGSYEVDYGNKVYYIKPEEGDSEVDAYFDEQCTCKVVGKNHRLKFKIKDVFNFDKYEKSVTSPREPGIWNDEKEADKRAEKNIEKMKEDKKKNKDKDKDE